jgi:hypothetical protein
VSDAGPQLLIDEILPDEYVPVAERLADEGVPIRAMSRSFKRPAEGVRLVVQEAIEAGRIVQMPKDDWPVGQSRDDRVPTFVRANRVNDGALVTSCMRLFKITNLQASLLAILILRNEVNKDTMHGIIEGRRAPGKKPTNPKMVDVVICNLRKRLRVFDLSIETLWARGYFIEPTQRKRILEMVNEYVLGKATQDDLRTESPPQGQQPTV